MKIKKIFIGLFLFIFTHIEQVNSKSLPPGTGAGDVPSNVLILLDKSGSMGWRMGGGTTVINNIVNQSSTSTNTSHSNFNITDSQQEITGL